MSSEFEKISGGVLHQKHSELLREDTEGQHKDWRECFCVLAFEMRRRAGVKLEGEDESSNEEGARDTEAS